MITIRFHPLCRSLLAPIVGLAVIVPGVGVAQDAAIGTLHDPREVHLEGVRQMTFGGENAEAYWSFDGSELVYQASGSEVACDQIFRLDPDKPGERTLVSTGLGRTTCAYFLLGDERIVYGTTHFSADACPPSPDHSQGYVWPIYSSYEIVSVRPDGTDLVRLTDNDTYDAEATVCPLDGSIVFTSTRDGDLDLYRMDADGSNVLRLTDKPGYDGGAFFNHDCSKIVWRASRPTGDTLTDFRRLLGIDLVRPTKLEIFVANADGTDAQQVTYLGAASFAPFFHPDSERIVFSSNHHSESGREFDVFSIRVDGSGLERITYTPGFDGFPMFSPDGRFLAFSSNRNQGKPGETDVYIARWIEAGRADSGEASAADRYRDDVAWLADDDRQGRGIGSQGIDQAAHFIADRFAEIGLVPAGDGEGEDRGFLQAFDVAVDVTRGSKTALQIDGTVVTTGDFVPMGFSADGTAEAEVVPAGYGISAADLDHDDYAHLDVSGKIVLVRRFVPATEAFEDNEVKRRFGDVRYKAFTARENGAVGMIVVDLPETSGGEDMAEEAPLPELAVDAEGHAGLPVVSLLRAVGEPLFAGGHHARLSVALEVTHAPTHNVVARLATEGEPVGGPVVIGAHYDHLGMGGRGSLAPDDHAPHNGADDNASGTAALFEIARQLADAPAALRREVWLVAFSGEESGLLGSTHFTKSPPSGLAIDDVLAMINLDMVGRLREKLSVLGAGSAEEWQELVPPVCTALGLDCVLGGDGYGPSDQTPFYAAGIPVLHLFTGTHLEYHRPSDDSVLINAAGGVRVASLAAGVATHLAQRSGPLTYVSAAAPTPRGDTRSYGASLGTIPDYADEGGGVLLAGVRPGSAAETAGMKRGDRLVGLAGKDIGDIYDFMYILRESKPGETVAVVVERAGERVELEVTFGGTSNLR